MAEYCRSTTYLWTIEKIMSEFKYTLAEAVAVLKTGGVILYPTDTVWGIGCDSTNEQAVSRIYEIKKRNQAKSLILLVADESMISDYAEHPSPLLLTEMKNAQSPTTAIFSHAINLPANLINQDGTIAIRIASDDFCTDLIRNLGKPVVSTSANISGNATPHFYFEIEKEIINGVDYVVDYRRDDSTKKDPSRIIRLNEHNELERIR